MWKLRADVVRLEAERKEQQGLNIDMRAERDDVNSKYIEIDKKDDRIKELKEDKDKLREVVRESADFESTLQNYRRERHKNRGVGKVLFEEEGTR